MGIALFSVFVLLYFLIIKYFKLNILQPLTLTMSFNLFFPFILYPILKSLTLSSFSEVLTYFDDQILLFSIVLVVYIFWFLGLVSNPNFKFNFKVSKLNFHYRDKQFAFFLYFFGISLYFLTFYISGINFIEAFNNPLGTRFQIINTQGAFHLRNVSLWFIWAGWFIILALRVQGHKISLILLSSSFLFIIFICIPLGQRYQLVYPIILLMLFLFYFKKLSSKTIITSGVILIILLPLFALYRELGNSKTGINIDVFSENIEILLSERSTIFSILSDRFENIAYFQKFLIVRDKLDMTIFDSIKGFFSLFIPASFTGGIKSIDVDTYLTLKIVGSQDFGTFSFTSFPEWYLNFGYIGFPLMGYISGLLTSLIIKNVSKIGTSIFALILFSDGFFLKIFFLNINSNSNISVLYQMIFALFVTILFKLFRSFRNKNTLLINSNFS